MSLFRTSNEQIPDVEQTSVRIPSLNGLSYGQSQQIQIYVDPSRVQHIIPKDSYLEFDVKLSISGTAKAKLMLDGEIGANSLFRNMRLFAGNKKRLISELVAYDSYVSLKYDYESSPALVGKRYVEGCTGTSLANEPSHRLGAANSVYLNNVNNPYFKKSGGSATEWSNDDFVTCKVTVPIHLPIFQMESVLPIVLMDGIFLECDLVTVSNNNPFRLLDSVLKERSPIFNPRAESVDIAATAETTWTNGSTATAFNLKLDNGMFNVEHCPFVVGSKVNLVKLADNLDTIDSSLDATITEISVANNKIKLSFADLVNGTGDDIDLTADNYALYEVGVKEDTTFSADFEISNVNLVLKKIDPSPQFVSELMSNIKAGGQMVIDYENVTNYQRSVLSSDRVVNLRIDTSETRCRGIISQPVDATKYTLPNALNTDTTYVYVDNTADISEGDQNLVLNSNRSGLTGCIDRATEYSWVIDQRLVPSRPINVSKMSRTTNPTVSAQKLVEDEKALYSSGITPMSFKAYRTNFFFGRALGLEKNSVQNLAGKAIVLQVNYNETQPPQRNKLFNNFLTHVNSLVIRDGSVEVVR
jgi:hypothetical protein